MNINGEIYSDLTTDVRPEIFWNSGERTQPIQYIVIHGTAGTNIQAVYSTWLQGGNRQASANYVVDDEGIHGCLGENIVAWHSGGVGAVTNNNSVGVEHLNNYIGNIKDANTYTFSDKTIQTGAKLVADICKRYGLEPNQNTILFHREVSATSCPQTLNKDEYVKLVQNYYYGNSINEIENNIKGGNLNMITITFKEDINATFRKNQIWLFNFNDRTYNYINHPEELKYMRKAYKEATGNELVNWDASKTFPVQDRLINGFKMKHLV